MNDWLTTQQWVRVARCAGDGGADRCACVVLRIMTHHDRAYRLSCIAADLAVVVPLLVAVILVGLL